MELENIQTVASLCCGVIGYSWALKFAMGGHEVYAYNRKKRLALFVTVCKWRCTVRCATLS